MRRLSLFACLTALLLCGCSSGGIIGLTESNGPNGARELRVLPFKVNPGACCDDAAKSPTPKAAKP